MMPFRNLPVKQKLMVLIIVITGAALLLSGAGLIFADAVLFHRYLSRDLSILAHVVADNSTGSLAFDDPESAKEILTALRSKTHVVAACLFRESGPPLAKYVRQGASHECAAPPSYEGIRSTATEMTVNTPVLLKGQRIGNLMIVYDLAELNERIKLYALTVLGVLLASSLVVVLLSSRLRTIFVTPILQLARATSVVSATKDYSVRAPVGSEDEIGQLAKTFNEMLGGIEVRDADLRKTLAEREEAFTRLAEMNQKLERSNEELARSNQDLERFAFIASHDLQEPLRMVTIYSQLLVKECGAGSDDSQAYAEHIVGGTTRMRDLIADLLAYLEITTQPGHLQALDPGTCIEKAKESLREVINETGAIVTTGPLPSIEAYSAHMVSLFQNLIGNSIKYRSEESPRIDISAEDIDGKYLFAVTDNGLGIAPEYHTKIFLAFKRLHGKEIPGTGIGLAICQRIVERYGGQIWVESDVGKGTTFKFTFPKPGAGRPMSSGTGA